MAKRLGASLLAFALLLFVGCSNPSGQPEPSLPALGQQAEETPKAEGAILSLPYFAAEGYNPYVSDNKYLRQISTLLLCNLVDIGPDMQLRYGAVEGVVPTGTEVVLRLRSGIRFAGGGEATTEDLAASLNAARESAAYSGRFAGVLEVRATEDAVTVTLAQPDPMFAWLLDIPLVKAGETASPTPAASGRYTLEADGALHRNEGYYGEAAPLAKLQLVQVAGHDEMLAAFRAGNIDLFATDDEGEVLGPSVAQQAAYPVNHLVFLGVNSGGEILAEAALRSALGTSINRTELAEAAYPFGNTNAQGLLHPLYGLAPGGFARDGEREPFHSAMESRGYTLQNSTYVDAGGETLSLRLLYYAGSEAKAAAVAELERQFLSIGLHLVPDAAADFEEYTQKILTGDYELYIGEVKVYNNMDFSVFFSGGDFAANFACEATAAAFQSWRGGTGSVAELEDVFYSEAPFLPLVWRTGRVYHTKAVGGLMPSQSDIFYDTSALRVAAEDAA